jgi:inositol-phosphate phosphatase/L-galactose 1-phosphate phosphatase/histidinol-phosphatase
MLNLLDSPQSSRCPHEFIMLAFRIADAVGRIHRRHFRQHVSIEIKQDGTPVTPVDREAERIVREMIAEVFPDHGVIGEEFPAHRPRAEYTWVVDPLDGTQLYIMGRPLFGLLLALAHNDRFILGMVDHAVMGERWIGVDGHGTYYNDVLVKTRRCAGLASAAIVRSGRNDNEYGSNKAIDAVAGASRWVQWGVTPYDYELVASGYLDMVIAVGPKLHDLAPLDPLIRNAGGVVTDWQGRAVNMKSEGSLIVCGDASLLPPMLKRLHSTGLLLEDSASEVTDEF